MEVSAYWFPCLAINENKSGIEGLDPSLELRKVSRHDS